MKPPKNPPESRYVTVACEHCEGGIEFDACQLEGDKTRVVECPHCHLETTVFDPEPETPLIPPELPASAPQDEVASTLPPVNLAPPEKELPPHEAFRRLLQAAEQGQVEAKCSVGLAFYKGLGVSKNSVEAVKWLQRAAEQGHATAQVNLSEIYEMGHGVTPDLVAAYKWAKLAAAQGREEAQKKCEALVLKMNSEQMKWARLAVSQGREEAQQECEALVLKMNPGQIRAMGPKEQILWRRQRLMPKQFSDFIGQKGAKARLEAAIAAAKSKGEALSHILLIGSPGLGTGTLASIIARAMGANLKRTCGYAIQKAGDLEALLTGCQAGDVLFIDEIHRLRINIAEYLYPAMKDFRLDMVINEGSNARSVHLNLPRFTLIGTTQRKGRLPSAFLSCFPMVENMEVYSIEELTAIASRFARLLEIEMEEGVAGRIARSADGMPLDVLNRLQHVQDYARVKSSGKITMEVAEEALNMLPPAEDTRNINGNCYAIPFDVRIKVWRRDNGKCVMCGSQRNLEFEHIIPVSKGGSNSARNVELLCERCNRSKSYSLQ